MVQIIKRMLPVLSIIFTITCIFSSSLTSYAKTDILSSLFNSDFETFFSCDSWITVKRSSGKTEIYKSDVNLNNTHKISECSHTHIANFHVNNNLYLLNNNRYKNFVSVCIVNLMDGNKKNLVLNNTLLYSNNSFFVDTNGNLYVTDFNSNIKQSVINRFAENGTLLKSFKLDNCIVRSLSVSPDNKTMIVVRADRKLISIDVDSGEITKLCDNFDLKRIKFLDNTSIIADNVNVYSIKENKLTRIFRTNSDEKFSFLYDNMLACSYKKQNKINLYNFSTGHKIGYIPISDNVIYLCGGNNCILSVAGNDSTNYAKIIDSSQIVEYHDYTKPTEPFIAYPSAGAFEFDLLKEKYPWQIDIGKALAHVDIDYMPLITISSSINGVVQDNFRVKELEVNKYMNKITFYTDMLAIKPDIVYNVSVSNIFDKHCNKVIIKFNIMFYSDKSIEQCKVIQPTKPVEIINQCHLKKPVEPTKPVETTKPVQPTKPIETANPVQPTKPTETEHPISKNIRSNLYNIDFKNMTITGIQPSTTIKEFYHKIDIAEYEMKIINHHSKTNIGTGTKIQFFKDNTLVCQLTAIVYGDITGDGSIGKPDLNLLNQHLLKVEPLNKYQLIAADINRDGIVNNKDLLLLKKYLSNSYQISQT